jgi:ornithine carbamoyltransferase
MSEAKHFLDLDQLSADKLREIMEQSKAMKKAIKENGVTPKHEAPLAGKVLAMIFDKPSTRTRVSFDVGMRQLGGETLIIESSNSQLGRGETIADTARVLSRFVDAIMIRTTEHDRLVELAKYATVPVINGLTDDTHPCQIMADIMTYEEHRGSIKGKTITWLGDGNNVLHSLLQGAAQFGYNMNIGVPEGREPEARYVEYARKAGVTINMGSDAVTATKDSDCVITDTWISMGDDSVKDGHNLFAPYQVNDEMMAHAKSDAIFMHCLPAHRNEEVTDSVMDGPQSVVFDEAENRLHAQKGILAYCFGEI